MSDGDDKPDFHDARQRMVDEQLRGRGIVDLRVLQAMLVTRRETFIPEGLSGLAYADRALSIDCSQTISQPLIVATMTQALELTGSERVLEVGTGSGYQTAVLAQLAREVVSIERHSQLSAQAKAALDSAGYANVTLLVGDGAAGSPKAAPFDRIIVTAAAEACPPALWDQLVEGGILVIPIGDRSGQVLRQIKKERGTTRSRDILHCRFVPLVVGEIPPGFDG